ncbi:cytochrome P450 2B4-like, partial [Clarias magur]
MQYGDLCCVYVGKRPMIVLNNVEMAKEALVQNGTVFSGRPHVPLIEWVTKGYGIVAVTYGHAWKQQRRFALHTLRNFGLGKKSVEERVAEEARCLITEMLKHEGKALDPMYPIMNAVSNIICSIIFGDRFDYEDKRFAKLLEILNENIRLSGSAVGLIFNLVPFIRHFPGPQQKILQNANALIGFIREVMEDHKKTLDSENLRDFIDAYLVEISKQKSNEDSTFHEDNLLMTTADLFLAGTETTATTLRWGLIFMMNHPEIQDRCHEEIIRVLGYDRSPTMDDRARMPYTHATVHEIQRIGNIVPFGVVHQTTETTQLQGYTIPKGTESIPNLTAIMQDKKHWKYPDTFNPENFLDENGQFCKNDSFLPFSLALSLQCFPYVYNETMGKYILSQCPSTCASTTTSVAIYLVGGVSSLPYTDWGSVFYCGSPSTCVNSSINVGLVKIANNTRCCNTNICNNYTLPVMPTQSINGRSCYTCDLSNDCSGKLYCEGAEDSCITAT